MKDEEKIIVGLHRIVWSYAILVSWLLMIFTVCFLIMKNSDNASEIIEAFSKTSSLWEVVLGVL